MSSRIGSGVVLKQVGRWMQGEKNAGNRVDDHAECLKQPRRKAETSHGRLYYYLFAFTLLIFLSPSTFLLFSSPPPSFTPSSLRFLATELLTLTTVEVPRPDLAPRIRGTHVYQYLLRSCRPKRHTYMDRPSEFISLSFSLQLLNSRANEALAL